MDSLTIAQLNIMMTPDCGLVASRHTIKIPHNDYLLLVVTPTSDLKDVLKISLTYRIESDTQTYCFQDVSSDSLFFKLIYGESSSLIGNLVSLIQQMDTDLLVSIVQSVDTTDKDCDVIVQQRVVDVFVIMVSCYLAGLWLFLQKDFFPFPVILPYSHVNTLLLTNNMFAYVSCPCRAIIESPFINTDLKTVIVTSVLNFITTWGHLFDSGPIINLYPVMLNTIAGYANLSCGHFDRYCDSLETRFQSYIHRIASIFVSKDICKDASKDASSHSYQNELFNHSRLKSLIDRVDELQTQEHLMGQCISRDVDADTYLESQSSSLVDVQTTDVSSCIGKSEHVNECIEPSDT